MLLFKNLKQRRLACILKKSFAEYIISLYLQHQNRRGKSREVLVAALMAQLDRASDYESEG